MNMNLIEKKIQQGDVILYKLKESVPDPGRFASDVDGRVILALGETTGHEHNIISNHGALTLEPLTLASGPGLESAQDVISGKLLRITQPTKLRHGHPGNYNTLSPEGVRLSHEMIELEVGDYIVRHRREYDFVENLERQVVD